MEVHIVINNVFGEVSFNYAWETKGHLWYNNQLCEITISADSYSDKDLITSEQEKSYLYYLREKESLLEKAKVEIEKTGKSPQLIPALLVIKRNGNMGLVFDDKNDSESGLVVTFVPRIETLSPDQYL